MTWGKCICISVVFLFNALNSILFATASYAATYYVSNNGSALWAQCTNISIPCSVSTAFANATAGDIVYFRGGTYNVPAKNDGNTYAGYYMPAHSGTVGNPITFQAYSGETPVFNGNSTGGEAWGTNGVVGETIFGFSKVRHIIIDGFTIQCDGGTKMARIHIGSADQAEANTGPYLTGNITLQNLRINGGTTIISGSDNSEGVRIDKADNVTIRNSVIYNYRTSYGPDWNNTAGIKSYESDTVHIYSNEFYNCSACIYAKSYNNNWLVYNNFIHGTGGTGINLSTNSHYATNMQVYNNLIVGLSTNGITLFAESDNMNNVSVYHNTVYSSGTMLEGCFAWPVNAGYATGWSLYNNICQATGSDYSRAIARFGSAAALNTVDYNNYGSHIVVVCGGNVYTSLDSLKAGACVNRTPGTHNQHSIATAPSFVNTSGTLSKIADFALAGGSPGKNAASDGADMGANMSLMGAGNSDINPPAAPTNLIVQ